MRSTSVILAAICVLLMTVVAGTAQSEAAAWVCESCGQVGNTGRFCGSCGHAQPSAEDASGVVPESISWVCLACGNANDSGRFCGACGEANPNVLAVSTPADVLTILMATQGDAPTECARCLFDDDAATVYRVTGTAKVFVQWQYDQPVDVEGYCLVLAGDEAGAGGPKSWELWATSMGDGTTAQWVRLDAVADGLQAAEGEASAVFFIPETLRGVYRSFGLIFQSKQGSETMALAEFSLLQADGRQRVSVSRVEDLTPVPVETIASENAVISTNNTQTGGTVHNEWVTTSVTCIACHGSKICSLCNGTGWYRLYGEAVPCPKWCSTCDGLGYYEQKTYLPVFD